jgi:cob(I)alamin adenosyltransferase
MGNRLTKIYTRTGDQGSTGLGDGSRVPKDGPRIEAFGAIDETNSAIGVLLAAALPDAVRITLPGTNMIKPEHVARLEAELDAYNDPLPPLKEFILPGGGPATAACHLARSICRRAERRTWTLAGADHVAPDALKYLNRLSDLLFVLARVLARHEGVGDVLWRR